MWPEHEVGARGSEAPSKLARSLSDGTTCSGEPESLPMFMFWTEADGRVSRARLRAVPCWPPRDDRCRAMGGHPEDPAPLSEERAEAMPAGKGILLHAVHLHSLAA